MRAVSLGIAASMFFATSFVLNRLMSLGGGSWIWSASLRYLFMLPILLLLVLARRGLRPLFGEMRRSPLAWALWSLVGFGVFYSGICYAAQYSPAWLVAGTWQVTIIAGSLLAPLFHEERRRPDGSVRVRRKIPFRQMGLSLLILLGIAVIELSQSTRTPALTLLWGGGAVLIAAFAYPLGNRKMMEVCAGRLDAYQRTLGMTVGSLPLWLALSLYQGMAHGLPQAGQVVQSLIVAVLSGVVATVLFFTATDHARHSLHHLAAVEATQAGEVVFALLGSLLLIPGGKVTLADLVGLLLIVLGMVLHSLAASRRIAAPPMAS